MAHPETTWLSPNFLQMAIQPHENHCGQIRLNGDMKQGCFLAPTPFSIFLSMKVKQTTDDLDDKDRLYVRYHPDGSLLNLRCFERTQTARRGGPETISLQAMRAERALQHIITLFADALKLLLHSLMLIVRLLAIACLYICALPACVSVNGLYKYSSYK